MKTLAVVKYLFTVVGIGMLVGAFLLYKNTGSFLTAANTAEGTVVDLILSRSSDSTTYRPLVRYTAPGNREIEFLSSTGSNPPSYHEGEKVEVLYLPSEPHNAKINGFFSLWGGAIILSGMGTLFFLIGAGIILSGTLSRRKGEYLKSRGTPIETDYQSVEYNTSLSVNGRHPFRVITQWQDPATSKLHIFKSNNLWFDPTNYITKEKITVFIERGNPKKYHVDLSFLPALAE